MSDHISVHQWQELYRAGAFEQDDQDARELAGWEEFDDPLNDRRVISLSKLVLSITHPFILDNYRVFFSEGQPNVGWRYASVCFFPLAKEQFRCLFSVDLDYPYAREKWALSTRRYGEGEMEFECGHIRGMTRYIQAMADELEQGVKPDFWPEKEAAQQYAFEHIPGFGCAVLRRESAHSYSAWQRGTERRIILHVAHSPGDAPPGLRPQDAVPMRGLYVFPQKETEKVLAPTNIDKKKAAGRSRKKRGEER